MSNPSPTFQWSKNGENIPGATNSSLSFSNVQPGDAGAYSVMAINSIGRVASATVTLTVNGKDYTRAITVLEDIWMRPQ